MNGLDLSSVYGPIQKLAEDLYPQEYKVLRQLMIDSDDLTEAKNELPETKEFEKRIQELQQKCNIVNQEMVELVQKLEQDRMLSLAPCNYSKSFP